MNGAATSPVRRLRGDRWYELRPDGTERLIRGSPADWVPPMTDAEIELAALSDPDAQPSTQAQLKRMRRVPLAKHVRWNTGLSQAAFAAAFDIPVGTLRDWEQGRVIPDQAARAYLRVIAADPKAIRRALKSQPA